MPGAVTRGRAAARLLVGSAALVLLAGPASAETLAEVLEAKALAPPREVLPFLDHAVESSSVLEGPRDVVVVFALAGSDEPELRAIRLDRASGRWTTGAISLARARTAGAEVAGAWCRRGLAIERFPAGFLVRAHVNPSAECTIAVGWDLAVRGVLGGWPVIALPDGRIVYQRNQVHFAAVHPVELGLWDPWSGAGGDVALYPREPYQAVRRAHVARMRAVYTEVWCRPRNHPCDPDRFDERLVGDVVTDARGDALAFVVAWEDAGGAGDAAGPAGPAATAHRPAEVTEVVYLYVGLRRPAAMRYREMLRRDFEARFGAGPPRRALDPDVVRALFGPARDAAPAR